MIYPSIRIEGAILSPDILEKLEDIAGQRPVDFGLDTSVKVKDEIARAWADAQDYWRIFNRKLETLKKESPATTETRNLWVVPLLGLLGYQLEFEAKSIELNAKLYPISHRITNRGDAAIHIIGSNEPAGLDRKPEKAALRMSAHAMLQEYLNLTEQLYGIVTNGRGLRLLRDSSRLVKLTYLEFDLDRIFTDGLFADFAVLYRLLHATRFPQTIETSASSLLESYHQETIEQGSRIRDGLRDSVKDALETLGTGFLAHPDNLELRQQVASGELRPDAYFNHLLRLIYRLLFLMVIEERGMVFPKGTATKNSTIYVKHYSIERLRRQAKNRSLQVTCNSDAWLQLLSTFHLFEDRTGAAVLGTTVLGGQLFSPANLGLFPRCTLSNAALYSTLEKLCFFTHPENSQRMPVNFGALATEEFGSVYESLLELHPLTDLLPAPIFGFRQAAGNERKKTGSYYTHAALVESLLQSALDPLLDEAEKSATPEKSILALKVCDPACGSGHFLIAAAQRIARRLARLRAGDEEPSPELLHHTLREVIGHCIFGVDINPMAAELCRVGLWLEAMEPGKSLTFLDHHIKCGNSLLGATPTDIRNGIPDKAYEPIAGDNKDIAKWWKKRNQKERTGQIFFDFPMTTREDQLNNLPIAIAQLEQLDDDTPECLAAKEEKYRKIVESRSYNNTRLLYDAWCVAFVLPKVSTDYGSQITTEELRKIEHNPLSVSIDLIEQIRFLRNQYRLFHWHLEFPVIFNVDREFGFDCIIGNPPWEMMSAGHGQEAEEEFARLQHCYKSNQYTVLNGRRDLYKLFLVRTLELVSINGIASFLTPLGVFMEDDSSAFRRVLFNNGSVIELKHFQNGRKLFFQHVDSRYRFCGVTFSRTPDKSHKFTTVAHSPEELQNQLNVIVRRENINIFLGEDCSATIYDNQEYAKVHQNIGTILRSLPTQKFSIIAEFHSSSDKSIISNHIVNIDDWIVLKNRNIHQFNSIFAAAEAWIPTNEVALRLERKNLDSSLWIERYPRLVFRDIARNDDERTLIACLAAPGYVSTYDTPMVIPSIYQSSLSIQLAYYAGLFNSFLFDFYIRPFVDKHIKGYTLERVPWPRIKTEDSKIISTEFIVNRVLKLSYTTSSLKLFANDCGFEGPPFQLDENFRFQLRCELDAAIFYLYGISRKDADYIMDSFPIVKRKDEAEHGCFRTKEAIFEIYDALAEAIRTGISYKTKLDQFSDHPPKPEEMS